MSPWSSVFAIGAGGFVGAVLRFWLSMAVKRYVTEDWLFAGTMAVNLLGCLLIGGVLVLFAERLYLSPLMFQCVMVGLLGSLTTFSTFAAETLELLRDGRSGAALLHVGVNLFAGILLVWLGAAITQSLLPVRGTDV